MENETTLMKMFILAFIIGLVTVATFCIRDFFYDAEMYDKSDIDTIEVPVVETNIYEFKHNMIYYGKN